MGGLTRASTSRRPARRRAAAHTPGRPERARKPVHQAASRTQRRVGSAAFAGHTEVEGPQKWRHRLDSVTGLPWGAVEIGDQDLSRGDDVGGLEGMPDVARARTPPTSPAQRRRPPQQPAVDTGDDEDAVPRPPPPARISPAWRPRLTRTCSARPRIGRRPRPTRQRPRLRRRAALIGRPRRGRPARSCPGAAFPADRRVAPEPSSTCARSGR